MTEALANNNERSAGIDIYKILAMFFVIWFHFSDHGTVQITTSDPLTFNWAILAISRVFGGICNCAFVLCTGYFLSTKKFNLERIVKLWLEVWFYSLFCGSLAFAFKLEPYSFESLIKIFLPFSFKEYWYFTYYLSLIVASPLINFVLAKLDKRQHLYLIIFLTLVTSYFPTIRSDLNSPRIGYIFLLLYIIAAYLRQYKPQQNLKNSLFGLLGLAAFLFEIATIFLVRSANLHLGTNMDFWHYVWEMHKLPCVITSLLFFIYFANLKVKYNRLIAFITPSLFAVYLLHIGRLWKFFFQILYDNQETYHTHYMLWQLISCSITIFLSAILIDKLRIYLLEKPLFLLINKFRKRPQSPPISK